MTTHRETQLFLSVLRDGIRSIMDTEGLSYGRAQERYLERAGILRQYSCKPGTIGKGTKVHHLDTASFITADGTAHLYSIASVCGSARWGGGVNTRPSTMKLVDKFTPVTCSKCSHF